LSQVLKDAYIEHFQPNSMMRKYRKTLCCAKASSVDFSIIDPFDLKDHSKSLKKAAQKQRELLEA